MRSLALYYNVILVVGTVIAGMQRRKCDIIVVTVIAKKLMGLANTGIRYYNVHNIIYNIV